MKKFLAIALAVAALSACSKNKDGEGGDVAQAPGVQRYCQSNDYGYGTSQIQGYGYSYGYGYNYDYSAYGYGQRMSPCAGFHQYNNGCPAGYAVTYSQYGGYSCYQLNQGYQNYYWQGGNWNNGGYLTYCGVDWTGTCPSGYSCTNSWGVGVCARW